MWVQSVCFIYLSIQFNIPLSLFFVLFDLEMHMDEKYDMKLNQITVIFNQSLIYLIKVWVYLRYVCYYHSKEWGLQNDRKKNVNE